MLDEKLTDRSMVTQRLDKTPAANRNAIAVVTVANSSAPRRGADAAPRTMPGNHVR